MSRSEGCPDAAEHGRVGSGRRALAGWLPALLVVLVTLLAPSPSDAQRSLSPGYAAGDAGLSPSERVGREIWFFATAFNDRFYTYAYPQRLGAAIDWYLILGAKNKADLFQAWGAIPDPDCCVPGSENCPARSLDETYGFQWCPGDDELLRSVGKQDYRDPACDMEDAPFDMSTPHGSQDQRQSACDLRYGTSTGVVGLRKFPNPRFDRDAWVKLNGAQGSWDGYRRFLDDDSASPDSRVNRLLDGSIEPPFRIGMACGACHVAFDPLNPPGDENAPEWQNLKGLVGNQYSRMSQVLASGMSKHRLEWQLIAYARPGTVDTSALPMDTVSNPGTMNAIINFAKRPLHDHRVLKWRKASNCAADADPRVCWCEPDKPGKCWLRGEQQEQVPHILKGGEDSIGFAEAVQRVYFNIGSCAEQCWLNHVPDLRAVDPFQRNYGQTPFDIGQCRRDCGSFRAIEDRLWDVVAFLLTARPTDLWQARGLSSLDDLRQQLDAEYGEGAVARGKELFALNCAGCHSSQAGPYTEVDFHAVDANDPTLRVDFLSAERPVPASRVGTYAARAMHSNHMATRVWDEYASRTYQERLVDPAREELFAGGGRGYYRPPSLLSLWAHAPFMHNNAIGPEICGEPSTPELQLYYSPYTDAADRPITDPPACWPFDPSIEGRYKLFKASAEALLYPERRQRKTFLTSAEIVIDVAPKVKIGDLEAGLSLRLPKDFPAVLINSLRYTDLLQDMVLDERNPEKLEAKYEAELTVKRFKELKAGLADLRGLLRSQPGYFLLDLTRVGHEFIQDYYSNVLDRMENGGHAFGASLSDDDKRALIAFLATL